MNCTPRYNEHLFLDRESSRLAGHKSLLKHTPRQIAYEDVIKAMVSFSNIQLAHSGRSVNRMIELHLSSEMDRKHFC